MKREIIALIVVILSVALLVMCKKHTTELNNTENNTLDRASMIENRILSFKDKIQLFSENSELKLGDPMLLDSCVWYVESNLNYTYADVKNDRDTMYFDSCFIDIDLINGRVQLSEAIGAYNKFVDTLQAQYDEITESNEHFLLADILVTSSSSNEATLCMLSIFVAGGPINIMSFNSTYDYWWFGNGHLDAGGYCGGPNNGNNTWDDAAQQIARKVKYRAGVPSGRYYPTNDFTLKVTCDEVIEYGVPNPTTYNCDLSNPNDETENDNLFDFLIFRSTEAISVNHHGCMTPTNPDEMNWYLNSMEDIVETELYDCVDDIEDLDFTTLIMSGKQVDVFGDVLHFHEAIVTYAELVFTSTSANSLD